MKISIDIDDKEFSEVINKGVKNIPEEDIKNVILESLRKFCNDTDVIKSIFFHKSPYSYSYSEPSKLLEQILLKNIEDDEIKDLKNDMLKVAKENNKEILVQTLSKVILNMVMTQDFKENLSINLSMLSNKVDELARR